MVHRHGYSHTDAVLHLDRQPIHEFEYSYSARGDRLRVGSFPVLGGIVDVLPHGISGLLITSDFQGFDHKGPDDPPRLLGEILCDELSALADVGDIPELAEIGAILCDDVFSGFTATDRGATGNVETIWQRFAEHFRWVAGVAGNHDLFSTSPHELFAANPKIHFLDGNDTNIDGLHIGGLSSVIGNPKKPFRRDPDDYLKELNRLCKRRPGVLALHEGPEGTSPTNAGNPLIREQLLGLAGALVVFGHSHWEEPLEAYGDIQLLNVEARAVILTAAVSNNL